VGNFGLFFTFFLLFLRFLPIVAIAEVKAIMPQADPHFHDHQDHSESKAH
jgi:molybdopterin-containing oxidoreductase family membrane subunit